MVSPTSAAPKRRGRPVLSERAIADMRQHIEACALRLFQQSGYGAVSIRRLAQEAGCTPMTIYRYFDRKIDILRALWASVFTALFDRLDALAALENDDRERLAVIAHGYVAFWLDNRDDYFLVFMSSGVSQTDVSIFVGDEPLIDRFAVLRDSLADALGLARDHPDLELQGQLLLCTLNGIAHNLITIRAYPWAPPARLTQAAVDAMLA